MGLSHRAACILVLATLPVGGQASVSTIDELKDLSLETTLVRDGEATAVIVAPPGPRYEKAVSTIRSAVRARTGVSLPLLGDESSPEALLAEHHVIALGNMATSRFVERMYRQWYVMLDLRYPGPGGHVVRTLHDPYGTGGNVVWIGGSDDAGVHTAAAVFAGLLGDGDPLGVGRLMEIELGGDPRLPETVADAEPGGVATWRDSFRQVGNRKSGSLPGGVYGWNPISLAGALYYMTGDSRWLDEFKRMALPDRDAPPLALRTSHLINNPADPLVESHHYGAHLLDLVWDLIEESPLLTDAERLAITRKLYEHQVAYDPDDSYSRPNGGRHGVYHMLSIYTGSRYFAKSYPHARWQRRIENVRGAFRSWIDDPTLAAQDTIRFIGSSIEPVLEFFIMDGVEELTESDAPRSLLGTLESVWMGTVIEESNRYVSLSLLLRAAYLLRDGRYLWLRDRWRFDTEGFRVGQSYWPPKELAPEAPLDLVGRISVAPLARKDLAEAESDVPPERAFQFASYRAGLEPSDDFFLVDGFYGRGRHPYHVGALYGLRMFEGRSLLLGHGNQIHVRRDGLTGPRVPWVAALERTAAFRGASYLRTRIPGLEGTSSVRHHLYVAGEPFVVVDELEAQRGGAIDISCLWELAGQAFVHEGDERMIRTKGGVLLKPSLPLPLRIDGRRVEQIWAGRLDAGETFVLTNALSHERRTGARGGLRVEPVAPAATVIRHGEPSLVAMGDLVTGGIELRAEAAFVTGRRLFMVGARSLRLDGATILEVSAPADLSWDLDTGELEISASGGTSLELHEVRRGPVVIADDGDSPRIVLPRKRLARHLSAAIDRLEPRPPRPRVSDEPEEGSEEWTASWSASVGARVTGVAVGEDVWVITEEASGGGSVVKLSDRGVVDATRRYDARPTSLWAAATRAERREYALLVGFRDDALRAFDRSGEELWTVRAQIHDSFKIGDRYNAPSFTDPRPETGHDQRGVNSILVGDFSGTGVPEIALGRPSTVEFREMSGELIRRIPTRWGDNTALALLTDRRARLSHGLDRMLLVGKFWTGSPWLTAIDRERRVLTDHAFSWPAPGATRMNAWGQRGLSHLRVADLDDDGMKEVVIALSGHWNELNVYDGADWRAARWTRSFGPGRSGKRHVRGVVVVPAESTGRSAVIVGTDSGWLHGFGPDGELLFARRLPSPVTALAEVDGRALAVVGAEDGSIRLVGIDGTTRAIGHADAEVTAIRVHRRRVYAGTKNGTLIRLDLQR